MGPRTDLFERKFLSPPEFDRGLSSPQLVAIPTELPGPHVCMYVCMYMCICVCVCVCICIYNRALNRKYFRKYLCILSFYCTCTSNLAYILH